MRHRSSGYCLASIFAVQFSQAVSAGTVQVSMTLDDPQIAVDETTTLRISAQVLDGMAGNGIYAYAINVLVDSDSIAEIVDVEQLGSPDPFFSSSGVVQLGGLRNVYGGDGGFFMDMDRGVGSPFEFLSIELRGSQMGNVSYLVSVADNAMLLGVENGFLLQQPGTVFANFGQEVTLTVIPEPISFTLVITGTFVILAGSMRVKRSDIEN